MKKIIPVLSVLLLLSVCSSAQQSTIQQPVKRCATYEVLENFRQAHPGAETDQQFEAWLSQKIQEGSANRLTATVVLPVVFHIIHDGETVGTGTNLSAAAIQQQVLQLNKDYANLSNSMYGVAADMEIQFALAQTDPLSAVMPEPGIDRVNRNTAGFSAPPYTVGFANPLNNYLNNTIKPATIWDPTEYLNIWILPMESGVLGIATFPASSGLSGLNNAETNTTAGAAVDPATVGSAFAPAGCSNYTSGKTLTHELGHFFGLRHIWGDGVCATDYCGDTPTHEGSNSGVPAHPKPNSCGTADEMFENYMDYTDDVTLNTFTADQKTRMQTVLVNSPRRGSLITSTVGLVAVTATNRIAFSDCSGALNVLETAIAGTYPRYRDISFNLNVEDKATGNATVTINTGGTAVSGVDYLLMTPSVDFVAGDDYKAVNLRIYDDALVEDNKTIILSYTISGTGVTAGPSAQTMTINILDDDDMVAGEGTVDLLSEDFNGVVTGWNLLSFSPSPVNTFTISTNGDAGGTGACAHVTNNPGTSPNTYTKSTSSSSGLRTPLVSFINKTNVNMSFKYRAWGETGTVDYGLLLFSKASNPTSYSLLAGPIGGGASTASGTASIPMTSSEFFTDKLYFAFYWTNNANGLGNDPPLNIDDVVITADGTQTETTVSSSYHYDMVSGAGVHQFLSTNNRIIATISNPGSLVSDVTASVLSAGTGTTSLTTDVGSFLRTNKVIGISPATPNTTTTYDVTLYFTTAELTVWGGQIPNLKVLKVNDGVSLSSTMTTSNSTLLTPVFEDHSAGGYYSYTVSATGFSQFMLVSPTTALPVELLSFEARAVSRSILLDWSTSQELNNKGFWIEKSSDGVRFDQIAWINGQINSSSRTDYTYRDNFVQPGITYHYRLRQTDIDGREKVSVIRLAKIDEGIGTVVTVSPNPVRDQFRLFISGRTGRAGVELLNAMGQVVRRWEQVDASSAPAILNLRGLSAGIYLLKIRVGDEIRKEKLVVQ